MPDMISCVQCKENSTPFVVPYDEIGVALMRQHMHSEHQLDRTPMQGDHRFDEGMGENE
jgi:hypothetical protein